MSTTGQSLRKLVTTDDGECRCPKCGEVLESMDAWMDHVTDEHDVYREFVQRWTRPEA